MYGKLGHEGQGTHVPMSMLYSTSTDSTTLPDIDSAVTTFVWNSQAHRVNQILFPHMCYFDSIHSDTEYGYGYGYGMVAGSGETLPVSNCHLEQET